MAAKLLLVLFAVITLMEISFSADFPKVNPPEEESCLNQVTGNKDDILAIYHGGLKKENNKDYNKYLVCIFRKIGFLDDEGEINFDAIKLNLNKNKKPNAATDRFLEAVVGSCRTLSGIDQGHTAVLVQNCLLKNLHLAAPPPRV